MRPRRPLSALISCSLALTSVRSRVSSAHRSPDGRLLVTTDDFRKINLFRYPCGPINAACRSAAAHAAHVGLARFTCDGAHIVSMGAADLTVMVCGQFRLLCRRLTLRSYGFKFSQKIQKI